MRAALIALAALALLLAVPRAALALCTGQDLIAALPAAERAALEARADSRPFARGNLWRAERDGQVIHLAGTYHLPDPRHEALQSAIRPLLEDASVLLVEAGPVEEAQLRADMARRPDLAMALDGPTLPEVLPEADWQAVAAAMRTRGVAPVVASRMRPWFVAMLLGVAPCAFEAVRAGGKGLDHRLIAEAQARALPIRALEPHDTIFRLFADLPQDEALALLRASVAMADQSGDMTATLANAYFAGRSQMLWDFTLQRAAAQPGADRTALERQFALLEEEMVNRRNASWIPVLLEAAAQGPVLAAFGALHMPGESGVLALLQAEGFAITPLSE